MRKNVYLGIMLLIASLFVSCKKDIAYEDDFSGSEKVWNSFKASSGNSYRYLVNHSSLAGSSTETIITVENGQVVGRSYVNKVRSDTSAQLVINVQWEENASSLGTHQGSVDPVTLDEIYHRAKSDWLKKRDNAKTYFETENDGMISLCGYVPDGCIDDCLVGIRIDYIEKL